MTIRIDGTNTAANPGITGTDTDTGLQFGTDEVKIVTGGTSRVTVDSDGAVGIGVEDPSAYYAENLVVWAGTEGGITIRNANTTTTNYLMFATANSGTDRYNGFLGYNHNTDRMVFGTDTSTRMSLDSDGLKFGSDTAAANALDDYEEGTFTPGLEGLSAGTGSFSPSSNNAGIYRKIGNIVYFQANLAGSWTNGTASGSVKITGLPVACRGFVSGEGGASYSPVNFSYMAGITPATAGYYRTGGLVLPNTTTLLLYQGNGSGGVQTDHKITEVSTAAGGVNWHFGGFYSVA